MLKAASECERRFGVRFSHIGNFPAVLLNSLAEPLDHEVTAGIHINGPNGEECTLNELSRIANLVEPNEVERRRYFDIFLRVLGASPYRAGADDLLLAPRREGALLAEHLGWLSGHYYTPDMKRIHWSDGLLVGATFGDEPANRFSVCRIVDGAIASGATIITLMERFSSTVERFEIYAVHATQASLDAIARYSMYLSRPISFNVGFVGGALNKKFYAVGELGANLIVGDVGDMICPLFD